MTHPGPAEVNELLRKAQEAVEAWDTARAKAESTRDSFDCTIASSAQFAAAHASIAAIRTLAQPAAAGEALTEAVLGALSEAIEVVQIKVARYDKEGGRDNEIEAREGCLILIRHHGDKLRRLAATHPLPASAGDAKNAARYRWLREGLDAHAPGTPTVVFGRDYNKALDGPFLDAAIDAAMNPDAATTGADAKEGM